MGKMKSVTAGCCCCSGSCYRCCARGGGSGSGIASVVRHSPRAAALSMAVLSLASCPFLAGCVGLLSAAFLPQRQFPFFSLWFYFFGAGDWLILHNNNDDNGRASHGCRLPMGAPLGARREEAKGLAGRQADRHGRRYIEGHRNENIFAINLHDRTVVPLRRATISR